MVSESEADRESVTGQPSQPSDRQSVLQRDAGTHEPDLSPSSHTIPHNRNPHWTNGEDHMLDIQSSSSKPNVSPHPLHSRLGNIEQEFIPLINADGDLHGLQASRVEDTTLNKKNADLEESFANSLDHLVHEDNKVTSEDVAGSETKLQDKEVKFDGDDDEEDDDEGDEEEDEKDDDDGDDGTDDDDAGNGEDGVVDNVDNNAGVDSHNDDVSVTVDKHLEQVNDVSAKSKDEIHDDSSQPAASVKDSITDDLTQPTAIIKELSSTAVNSDSSVESGSLGLTDNQHSRHGNQKAAASSSRPKFEQESSSQSDANTRQEDSSHSGHINKVFGQQEAEVNQRGYWHPDSRPVDVRFPSKFNHHLHRSTHPVWKHVHSSPVEEFRDNWPEMQDAYRSRPELMQEQQHYMNQMTDLDNFMQRHQRHFMNHQHQSHIRPVEGHYFQNQRTPFSGQDPDLLIDQWPDEDAEGRLHFRDTFNNEQRYGHSYYNQEAGIRRPNIHIDQVYRQLPHDQTYVSSFDKKDPDSGPVDEHVSSVGTSKQSGYQADVLTVDHSQRSSTDKSQSDQSDVNQGIQRPSSAQWPEKDTAVAEELTKLKQAINAEYYGDADILSSSQKYTDEALQPPSTLIDRRAEPISGE